MKLPLPLFYRTSLLALALSCSLAINEDDLSTLEDGVCGPDEKACDNRCVQEVDPAVGCGSLNCVPCSLENAVPYCQEGKCAVASCLGDARDCNDRDDDGCEVDIAHDANHCGGCDDKCAAPPNAEPGCRARECTIGRCHSGYRDCNDTADDGCETDLREDAQHCGECHHACADDERCQAGQCTPG